jgi:hypothetical protein
MLRRGYLFGYPNKAYEKWFLKLLIVIDVTINVIGLILSIYAYTLVNSIIYKGSLIVLFILYLFDIGNCLPCFKLLSMKGYAVSVFICALGIIFSLIFEVASLFVSESNNWQNILSEAIYIVSSGVYVCLALKGIKRYK